MVGQSATDVGILLPAHWVLKTDVRLSRQIIFCKFCAKSGFKNCQSWHQIEQALNRQGLARFRVRQIPAGSLFTDHSRKSKAGGALRFAANREGRSLPAAAGMRSAHGNVVACLTFELRKRHQLSGRGFQLRFRALANFLWHEISSPELAKSPYILIGCQLAVSIPETGEFKK